jgi:hypothetical protein
MVAAWDRTVPFRVPIRSFSALNKGEFGLTDLAACWLFRGCSLAIIREQPAWSQVTETAQ